jgi:methionyl-tRNA formyltransferase
MKIIFMGSAAFAVPSLNELHKAGHNIEVVITQPDKPAGRGRKLSSPPVAEQAKQSNLPLYQPKSVKAKKVIEKISSLEPDIIVIVAYGKILPKELLELPRLKCVNVHASLLPKYRGAAPMNWAIVNGEKETGVTTMFINEELDAGDMLLSKSIPIGDDDTTLTLQEKLASIGADVLLETIEKIKDGTIKPEPQDGTKATFAPIMKKEDGYINWNKGSLEIRNLIRGMQPWPSAYTHLDGKMLKIYCATILETTVTETPGTVLAAGDDIVVATGDGKLCINELQLEGKRRMTSTDFLHGHKVKTGTILE